MRYFISRMVAALVIGALAMVALGGCKQKPAEETKGPATEEMKGKMMEGMKAKMGGGVKGAAGQ